MPPISVLVVDDSSLARRIIADLLASDPSIRIAGTAGDGKEAVDRVPELRPDVILMDVEMPRMDGLAALQEIMAIHPTPTVMLSAHTKPSAPVSLRALALGAVDFVAKPSSPMEMQNIRAELIDKIQRAATIDVRGLSRASGSITSPSPVAPAGTGPLTAIIGGGDGGRRSLREVIGRLPGGLPLALLIVQSTPRGFFPLMMEDLQSRTSIELVIAQPGDAPAAGKALVIPPDAAAQMQANGRLAWDQGRNMPIDALMTTAVKVMGQRVVGVLISGRAPDGVTGIRSIRQAGGATIVEHASTATVYEGPAAAIAANAAEHISPASLIANELARLVPAETR